MTKLFDQIKAHPFIAYILMIIPPLGISVGCFNFFLNRAEQASTRVIDLKETEIETLKGEVARQKEKMARMTMPTPANPNPPQEPIDIEDRLPYSLPAADYFTKLHDLDGRYAELEQLYKTLEGKVIDWSGIISSVQISNVGESVVLRDVDGCKNSSVTIYFQKEFKPRIMALRKGDKIKFKGWVTSAEMFPVAEVTSFEVVPQ